MKFFLIHGAYGTSNDNWFPWLKNELEKLGHKVITPNFPTPENQTLDNWMKVFDEYIDKLDSETILVGHSMATAFILSILEKINIRVKACFFVAGWLTQINHPLVAEINKTFLEKEFNWDKILNNCEQFFMFNSESDPYVPFGKVKLLEKELGIDLINVLDAGHFNKDTGYTKFKLLLEKIKQLK